MTTQILWTSPTGTTLDLLTPGPWIHSIAFGGLKGMVGTINRTTHTAVGVPGETPTTAHIPKMTGELTLYIASTTNRTVEDITKDIRREISQTHPGTLHINRPHTNLHTHAYRAGPVAPPAEILTDADFTEFTIPLVAYGGGWLHEEQSSTGVVSVANTGDGFCWPRVQWWGKASVTLPSGTVVPLPWNVGDAEKEVSTDPWTSHEVTLRDGTLDEVTSRDSGLWPLAEGVPVGQSRTYRVSGDARLVWQLTSLDPWE